MALPSFESLGLTKKESDIYELLLKGGELPVHKIISLSRLKRATVYKSLYGLEQKGLATKKIIHKKIHFKPEPPSELAHLADSRMQDLSQARVELASLLPQLTQQYITSVEKPIVKTYQGVEGLKAIYEDTIKEGKAIYAALTTADVDSELFNWVTRTYTKKRIAAKIPVKVLVASGGWTQEYLRRNEKELRETRLVSALNFPFQHEVDIYGDKVAFIDFRKGGSLIGIVIHHPHIATTMRALWELGWLTSGSHQSMPSK